MMEIGTPERRITVEPIREAPPAPAPDPEPAREPAEPEKVPA